MVYAEIQDDIQKWRENVSWGKSQDHSADYKNLVEIALSHTVSKINAFLHFVQKFKMATKNGGKITIPLRGF